MIRNWCNQAKKGSYFSSCVRSFVKYSPFFARNYFASSYLPLSIYDDSIFNSQGKRRRLIGTIAVANNHILKQKVMMADSGCLDSEVLANSDELLQSKDSEIELLNSAFGSSFVIEDCCARGLKIKLLDLVEGKLTSLSIFIPQVV